MFSYRNGGVQLEKCIVCNNQVDWENVKEEFEDYFILADGFGVESLTENAQVVLMGKICSYECYEEMD